MKKLKEKLGHYLIIIIAAWIVFEFSNLIQSSSLNLFLMENLITLLFALLAINLATLGVIMTKLKDISDQYIKNGESITFTSTINSMKHSINEQIALIALASLSLLLSGSQVIANSNIDFMRIFQILNICIFIVAIQVLSDTGKAVFRLMKHEDENNDNKKRDSGNI
jgi:hypothetical protein